MSGRDTEGQRWGDGGANNEVSGSSPGPWFGPQVERIPAEAKELSPSVRQGPGSSQSPPHLGRTPGGFSTDGLETRPVVLGACGFAGMRSPGWRDALEALVAVRCSGSGDVLPPSGCVACKHSKGPGAGRAFVSSPDIPGAGTRGAVKMHRGGERSHQV